MINKNSQISFDIHRDTACVQGELDPSVFFSAEVRFLNPWFRRIARRLKYDGPIKMVHQDQHGVLACHMKKNRTGEGTQIAGPKISHTSLLEKL